MDRARIDEIIQMFKNKDSVDDNCKYKEIIKENLLLDTDIIHFLDASGLDPECPDDYIGKVILPMYMIPETQSEYKNYLCFAVTWDGDQPYYGSEKSKNIKITFYILCEGSGVVESDTGLARHDLIAALIKQRFCNTNLFGCRVMLTKDMESVTDTHYATRTIEITLMSEVEGCVRQVNGRPRNVANTIRG